MKKRPETAAFTMLEILTVMAVITMLAGMMFPIYNRVRASAQNAAATDLCSQVAAAWNMLLVDNRRFPSMDLLQACSDGEGGNGGFAVVDGDLVVRMSPGVGNLLNWWKRENPVPAGDKKKFKPRYASGSKKGQDIALKPGDEGSLVENWPADTRFERDVAQKRFGVFAPWFTVSQDRALKSEIDFVHAVFALDAEEETTKAQEEAAWNGIVTVALDLDGDGQVPVLVPVSGKDFVSSGGDVEKIPASAAAWVSRKDGRRTKICKSW